jgi:cellulose 1,4-beta-cellobiosidase
MLKNIGSRIYFLKDKSHYQTFDLKNKKFTFKVDYFNLDCGLNGSLYFSSMDEYGWTSRFSIKKAEVNHGTEYFDAQCSNNIKFINSEANVENWKPKTNDENADNDDIEHTEHK